MAVLRRAPTLKLQRKRKLRKGELLAIGYWLLALCHGVVYFWLVILNLLLNVYCLLSIVYCLLSTVYWVLGTWYLVLGTVYCLLQSPTVFPSSPASLLLPWPQGTGWMKLQMVKQIL